MSDNSFFKPTLLYKEFMILDLIEKDPHITQREMAEEIGVAVSMINSYVDEYEKKGLIKRKKHSTKTVEYFVTKKGSERKKVLNIGYLNSSQRLYNQAKENIEIFLKQIEDKGFKNILLYGAGEVAELFLSTMNNQENLPMKVLAIIDDNPFKQNSRFMNYDVIPLDNISMFKFDGILISSYTNSQAIFTKLRSYNVDLSRIIQFFV